MDAAKAGTLKELDKDCSDDGRGQISIRYIETHTTYSSSNPEEPKNGATMKGSTPLEANPPTAPKNTPSSSSVATSPPQPPHPESEGLVLPKQRVALSQAKNDRFGSSLTDMVFGDAYAFAHNLTYAGACRDFKPPSALEMDPVKDELLARLGFTHWEPYGAPCPEEKDDGSWVLINSRMHRYNVSRWITEDYLESLHGKLKNNKDHQLTPEEQSKQFVITAHLRRGDLDLCFGNAAGQQKLRYLPNAYYLATIDRILEQHGRREDDDMGTRRPVQVNVFVEEEPENSTESLAPFRDRGYHVHIGGDEYDVWHSMIQSDAFIMSNSFFSCLPAILKPHGDIYSPVLSSAVGKGDQRYKIRSWKEPTEEVVNLVELELERLLEQCPFDQTEDRMAHKRNVRQAQRIQRLALLQAE